jgi:thiol-disulfide isomerase/thioredoxin
VTPGSDAASGSLRKDQAQLMFGEGFSFSGYERDPLFLGLDDGTYLDIAGVSGIDALSDGRAAVFADLDNDGDHDVFLTTLQGEAHQLFRNNVGQDAHHLRVIVDGGTRYGRDAFGTVVRVPVDGRTLTKIKTGGMGYLAQHDGRLLFGLGIRDSVERIDVTWPDGRVERFDGPFRADGSLRVTAGTGRAEPVGIRTGRMPDPLTGAAAVARSLGIGQGQPLPDLVGTTLDGQPVRVADLRQPGRRLLVNVWATWCGPCLREMREIEHLRPGLESAGIDVLGLNVDTDAEADLAGFLRRTGASYRVVRGGVPAIEALYTTDELTVPLSLLVDERGIVREIMPGWSDETRRRFSALAGAP